MTIEPIIETFKLSDRLSVTMTATPGRIDCAWSPDVPTKATRQELAAYDLARDLMTRRLVQEMGEAGKI